jgi:hypothetical protein
VKAQRWFVGAALLAGALVVTIAIGLPYLRDDGSAGSAGSAGSTGSAGPTVAERLGVLRAERAALQARADGEARIFLIQSFRIAGLLADALIARGEPDRERAFDRLPAERQRAFALLDALNDALTDALARPGAGSRELVEAAAKPAAAALEQLGGTDQMPLVLQFTPTFVPPRRATGELTLAPGTPRVPSETAVKLDRGGRVTPEPTVPTVPRYAPSFAASNDDDPPVSIEIVGLRLAPDGGAAPTLTIGSWRGTAQVAPERLRFSVPRGVFATETARTTFVTGVLGVRRDSRTATFELLFTVLPDRPGSFALDQKVRTTVPESQTLVSPEILARGEPGEMRTVRRCFDPPQGWRFDQSRRRVVVVEKLASDDDVPDPTLNSGTVEFADGGKPGQICVTVTAKPVTRTARAATIGRFEATLLRDRVADTVERTGVRALDWREAVRVPLDPATVEWKLYVRLFDEIDRDFSGKLAGQPPFLRITPEDDGKSLVLQADPTALP